MVYLEQFISLVYLLHIQTALHLHRQEKTKFLPQKTQPSFSKFLMTSSNAIFIKLYTFALVN